MPGVIFLEMMVSWINSIFSLNQVKWIPWSRPISNKNNELTNQVSSIHLNIVKINSNIKLIPNKLSSMNIL